MHVMNKMADSVTMSARKSSWFLFIWGDVKNVLPVEVNNVEVRSCKVVFCRTIKLWVTS